MPKYLSGAVQGLIKVEIMPIDPVSNTVQAAGYDEKVASQSSGPGKNHAKAANEGEREVQKLAERDRQVRTHEAAHIAAGGQYVRGGVTFQYQKGPDGKMYAIGGEVSIDCSPVRGDPRATVMKMQAVKRAAMAPADPSGQDCAVAAAATAVEAQARQEAVRTTSSGGGQERSESAGTGFADARKVKKSIGYTENGEAIASSKDATISPLDLIA
jgi:hypothetical protein